ncbi:MAG TPA: hypothetical protein VM370_13435 [Candidatus Thermoplasmatota archaeon]|nr:hypothetical protein [Candidatus Thermoplasmatota archaeon]
MALRATSGPAPVKKSARVGDRLEFCAKIENTSEGEEVVALVVEGLTEGPLAKQVDFAFAFEPARVVAKPRTRTTATWTWVAALPAGKTSFTFRGRLALERADGTLVSRAPLDLYVSET